MKRFVLCLSALVTLCFVINDTKALFQSECSSTGLIAYGERNDNGSWQIFLINGDGSNRRQLTTGGSSPAWSPDGLQLAYSNRGLRVIDAEGLNDRLVTNEVRNVNAPSWSPDGTRIVFAGQEETDWDVFVVNVDGTNLVNLTDNEANDQAPTWSPDGSVIAFDSDREGPPKVYLMEPDGSNVRELETDDVVAQYPVWSPDGSQLAYVSQNRLMIFDLATTELVSKSLSIPVYSTLSWSPDGNSIAFGGGDKLDIYVMNLDDGNLLQLTTRSDSDLAPSWQPCISASTTTTTESSDDATNEAPTEGSLTITEAQLLDVDVSDDLIMTLPDNWLTWRFADYPDVDSAFSAFEAIYTDNGLNPPLSRDEISNYQFQAIYPATELASPVSVTAFILPLDELAASVGTTVADFTADIFLDGLGANELFSIELNGRGISVGTNARNANQLLSTFVFPEQGLAGFLSMFAPSDFSGQNLELLGLLMTSLRPESEPLAIDEFNTFTGQPLPPGIELPSIDAGTATEAAPGGPPITPTSTDMTNTIDPTAELEDTAITCTVVALVNANMRVEPNTSATVTGRIIEGTTAEAVARTTGQDGYVWFQLENESWVRSDVVSFYGEDCTATLIDFDEVATGVTPPVSLTSQPTQSPRGTTRVLPTAPSFGLWKITMGDFTGTILRPAESLPGCPDWLKPSYSYNETAIMAVDPPRVNPLVYMLEHAEPQSYTSVTETYVLPSTSEFIPPYFISLMDGTYDRSMWEVYDASPVFLSGHIFLLPDNGTCGIDFQVEWIGER